jgi:hypothetical protein
VIDAHRKANLMMTSTPAPRQAPRKFLIALFVATAAAMDDADATGCSHVPDMPDWWGEDSEGNFCLIIEGAGGGGESGGGGSDGGSENGDSTCSPAPPQGGPACYPGDAVPPMEPPVHDSWELPKTADRASYWKEIERRRQVANCHRISNHITDVREDDGFFLLGKKRTLRRLWGRWDAEECKNVMR